jgi:acyl-CoA synthetase (AMP-forming)/AMP-acid ligase II
VKPAGLAIETSMMPIETPARAQGLELERVQEILWIGDIPGRGAQTDAERIAIIFAERNETLSYAQLDRYCDAFANGLLEAGLQAGDRIAYLGANNLVYLPVLLGALRAGIILVPLNWRLAAEEIFYQLDDSQSRLLFCDLAHRETAVRACSTLKNPPRIISTDSDDDGLRAMLEKPGSALPIPHDADQPVLQLYTSGTTGKPKGVLLSHGELSIARHIDLATPELSYLSRHCVTLSAMPNFHIGGMSWVLMTLSRAGTVVLTADPSPANLLRLMQEYPVEFTFIVPTVIRAIIDSLRTNDTARPKLKGIFYGAMPIGESLLRDTMALLDCKLTQFFGMTETAGTATFLSPEQHNPNSAERLKSVGRPMPGVSIEIRSPDRRVLAVGEHGEIWIKSPTIMLGYWKLPEKTSECCVDGWYATGDGGCIDADGFLYLTDRIKDMIISGGENVYPSEVEEVLRQHPAVLDAAVVGIPDAYWGEKVAAVVELRPSHTADESELRDFMRDRIAKYKCPKAIHFATALPRTASGKVRRVELRDQLKSL